MIDPGEEARGLATATSDRGQNGQWPVMLLLGFVVLGGARDFERWPWVFYVSVFVSWAGLVHSWRDPKPMAGRTVLLVALLIRLVTLVLPPTLSDDIYRYVWDGRVVLAGANPYTQAPDSAELVRLRDERWALIAHRDVETVYPPLALGMFAAAAVLPEPELALRVMVLVADMFCCGLVLFWLRRSGRTMNNAVLYAWNPMVVIEGVGMGHVDVLGATTLMAALCLACSLGVMRAKEGSNRTLHVGHAAAGGLLAAGILIKLVPLILVPLWIGWWRSWRFAASLLTVLVVGIAPVAFLAGMPPGLMRYGISWEFNGALFEPMWRLLSRLGTSEVVKGWVPRVERVAGVDLGWLYQYIYPQLLSKLVLATVLLILSTSIAWKTWRRETLAHGYDADPELRAQRLTHGSLLTLVAFMVCTATIYPWYLLWALPLAAVLGSVPVLVLSASLPLAYLPRLLSVPYMPWVWLAVWGPFLIALVWSWRSARRNGSRVASVDVNG